MMLSVLFSFKLSEIWPVTSSRPQQLNGFAELACAPFGSCSGFFDPSIPLVRTLRPGFSLVELIGFSRKTALLIVLVHLKIFGFIFMALSAMVVLFLVGEEKYGFRIAQKMSRRRYKALRLAAYTMTTVPWVLYLCSPMLFN
uniref:DUF1624 domain-containing protein n=2 Tax=Bursaphelenchus xylophilus TaxID=6326 RepID=A0A1I7S9V5_BURXY